MESSDLTRQTDYSELLEKFFERFGYFSSKEKEKISRAWGYLCKRKGGETREGGETFVLHPLRVAEILAGLSLDGDTITAAILHGALGAGFSLDELRREFGDEATSLIEGTRRLSALKMTTQTIRQAETVRKMFFAMVDDVRIILIRLADRLDKMRGIGSFPKERQKALAQETADIWAPLANRLGIAAIKDELEDLSLKFSNREVFDYIKRLVAAKKGERAGFLESAVRKISAAAAEAGIEIDVQSRAKHFWSIYQKMKRRGKEQNELYDLLAVRILCGTPAECYSLLGIVHTIWKPLEGRFKDYIAMPKANGYQSLHTTVMCDEGRPLEIQIRTRAMHEVAENGIASHWLYKRGTSNEEFSASDIPVIARMKELVESRAADEDFLASLKHDILGDSIFVFTPKGDVIELPAGSTAIDFAYAIHSAVGEKISGAKADGAIIPLSRPLKNTQVIEIITHPQAHPTVNQYNSARTAKARQKIRAYLAEHGEGTGFEHHGPKKEAANAPHPPAKGSSKHGHSAHASSAKAAPRHAQGAPAPGAEEGQDARQEARRHEGAQAQEARAVLKIRVGDSTKYLVKFAKCCNPEPMEPVVGYVSRGRGVIIHSKDCANVRKIPEAETRLIPVEWAGE